jgi:hypothetical protein
MQSVNNDVDSQTLVIGLVIDLWVKKIVIILKFRIFS